MKASAGLGRHRRSVGELWERFARERAEYYTCTEIVAPEGSVDLNAFFGSGEPEVAEILHTVGPWLRSRGVCIDVGCGVGRLALPMASRFELVYALDVSETMLKKLQENVARRGIENVAALNANDADSLEVSADLVYSRLVLQHIESFDDICCYLRLIRAWIGDAGVAYLQFDTRRRTVVYRLRNHAPESLLPQTSRRGIRRIRRPRADVLRALDEAGLAVLVELRPRTADHVFVVGSESIGVKRPLIRRTNGP